MDPDNNQVSPQYRYPYGLSSDHKLTNLEMHLLGFKRGIPIEAGGAGKPFHFWKIVNMLWGKGCNKKFLKHPWAERMVDLACRYNWLTVHGCASSGKSAFGAVWGLVNWLCDPLNTLVLATSTSLKEARGRIWGEIVSYYQSAKPLESIGKLVDSTGMIITIDQDGNSNDHRRGISLIAGEKKKEKENIGKLIGLKNKRVFLLADELPELSEALIEAAKSNLSANPSFQMIAFGNFKSIYDPMGVFMTPKGGWASVSPDDEEWETSGEGYALKLDGTKSPNVKANKVVWPGIYSKSTLETHYREYGENSAAFWRMCRSHPCPEAESKCLYSDADFIKGAVHETARWLDEPIMVAAADPAFSTDGDTFSVAIGKFGRNENGLPTLEYQGINHLYENIELTKSGEARDLQTARQLAQLATDSGVRREHLGVDCSGPGGLAFGSILSIFWGSRYYPIKFGEKGSDMPVSDEDQRKGEEAFNNLASEMWFMGRSFIRSGQIKGLPISVVRQLKARHYETKKAGDGIKMIIEPKAKMKIRIGESPDDGDAALMLIHLCRVMFNFSPGGISGLRQKPSTASSWMNRVKKAHSIYQPQGMFR